MVATSFWSADGKPISAEEFLNNRCDRAAICKIRISAHPLMIEGGRHLNIPRTERYCLLCKSNQIEDEFLRITYVCILSLQT
jgi:hypothetical protein